MNTFTNHIDAGSYRIHAGGGALAILNSFLSESSYLSKRKFILCDENTMNHCVPPLLANVNSLKEAHIIEVEPGENSKNLETCRAIWESLAEQGAGRDSVLINVGGGMVCDLGGFCAGTYMRGIPYINVPTTLLAQADAAFGGKTGVDLGELKNMVGLFNPPASVFSFPGFLSTLEQNELNAGFAEVIKHALIADKNYWTTIKSSSPLSQDYDSVIPNSVKIKMTIVTSDPSEEGRRKLLNFGHTAGHAIESWYLKNEEPVLHGNAVAAGILVESFLSHKKDLLKKSELNDITRYIAEHYGESLPSSFNVAEVVQLMSYDKKNMNGNINFTVLNGIGNAVYDRNFETTEILEALEYARSAVSSS